jgi:hypothetical protein
VFAQGLLFENESIQIFLRHEYANQQGMLSLGYKNPGVQRIENLTATATSTTAGILVQSTPVQPSLGPQEQTSQQMRVICMEPFNVAPSLLVEFTTADAPDVVTKHSYPIPLPVSILHFLSPLEMDRATFLAQWNAIAVPEIMDTFASTRAINPDVITAQLSTAFKMGVVRELTYRNDSLQLLTMACSLETGTLSPAGKQLRVGALVRLEVSLRASAFRLTIRAVHPACAQALFRGVKQQILSL